MMSSNPNKPRLCPWPPDSAALPPSTLAKRTGFRPIFSGESDSGQVYALSPPQPLVKAPERPKLLDASLDLDAGSPVQQSTERLKRRKRRSGANGCVAANGCVCKVSVNAKKYSILSREKLKNTLSCLLMLLVHVLMGKGTCTTLCILRIDQKGRRMWVNFAGIHGIQDFKWLEDNWPNLKPRHCAALWEEQYRNHSDKESFGEYVVKKMMLFEERNKCYKR